METDDSDNSDGSGSKSGSETEMAVVETTEQHTFLPGTRVEVRKRFDETWARGFEIVGTADDGYRVRRLSDGSELPAAFSPEDLRRERKRNSMWWY